MAEATAALLTPAPAPAPGAAAGSPPPAGAVPGAKPGDGQDTTKPGYWPQDWRQKWAGEDSKKLARLERYTTPEAAFDALVSVQGKISAGELRSNLPKDATPEQVTAWRKDNGVPDAPDKYEIGATKGRVIGDEDKVWVGDLAKTAHSMNLNNNQLNGLLDWHYGHQQKLEEKAAEEDNAFRQAGEDKLRVDWGPEYRRNLNLVKSLLGTVPEAVRDDLAGARLANGKPLFSHPDALKWLAQLQLQLNPMASVMPSSGGDMGKAIANEIMDLEKMMGNKMSDYWKGPKAETLQARYRDLVDARDINKRAA